MKTFTTILLANTLKATVDHIERHPEVSSELIEFKDVLISEVQRLRAEDFNLARREDARNA